jgi:uncharacterized protein involved in exopolysaccharide biosynthesis
MIHPAAQEPQGAGTRQVVVVPVASVGDEDAINLADVGRALWRGKSWILGLSAAAALLFGLRAWLSSPIYRADALVAVVDDAGSGVAGLMGGRLDSLASMAGVDLGGGQGRRGEFVAMLSSRAVARELIESDELTPVLFASRWDPQARMWRRTWLSSSPPTLGDAVERFHDRALRVMEDDETGLITVRVELPARELSAKLANRIVELVNEKIRQTTIADARRGIAYLNRELARTTEVEVRQGAFRLLESNLQQIMLANVQEQYALKIVDPAVAPEAGRFVQPRPLLETLLGVLAGCLLGSVVVLWQRRRMWLPHHRLAASEQSGQELVAKS